MSNKKHYRETGFTIIELLIVITILTMLYSVNAQFDLLKMHDKIDNNKRVKTVTEINKITESAGNYIMENSTWPDSANTCAGAITTLTSATPAYLYHINTLSQYNTSYLTSCDTNTFTVSVDVDTNSTAAIITNQIGGATHTATVVSVTVPKPSELSALDKFLLLDGSRAMTGDLNMGGNSINNVADVTTSDGRTLVNVSTIEPLPTAILSKPSCGSKTAVVNLAVTGIVLSSAKIPYSHPPFIESETAGEWTVRLNVYDEDGAATAVSGTYVQAITSCE